MEARSIDGFWFVWREGLDWPEHFYNEKVAKDRAALLARSHPGQAVYVGDLNPRERLCLPDKIDVMKIA